MIVLPFPAKVLWPNGRGHHMAKHREFQKHKEWARLATLEVLPRCFKHNGEQITLKVAITPKTSHAIDADNAVASLKAYFDGIALALNVNDSTFTVPEIVFSPPKKPGAVSIDL